MAETIDSVTDYRKTQRVVLLVDLNPLLHFPDPRPYIDSLLSAIRILVTFPPLASSLFSFKLFFSSLSPLLSSSKLPIPSPSSLSFDRPASTYDSLSQTLNSSVISKIDWNGCRFSRASHLAASMRQLIHDYAWDSVVSSSIDGTPLNCGFSPVRSNLIVLFSPIIKSVNGLSEFLGVDTDDECLRDVKEFTCRYRRLFGGVNDAFVSRDIHFSWVDVKCPLGSWEVNDGCDESLVRSGVFESGIRDLGWGFCSSDNVVLGSAVVPFGLIYPKIGISPKAIDFCCSKMILARLSLEILNVNGKPLECKCCDLELSGSNSFPKLASSEQEKSVWEAFGDGNSKLHVKAVKMDVVDVKSGGYLPVPVLVHEVSGRIEKEQHGNKSELFEDKVLQMLEPEMLESLTKRSGPIWQILLSFLYREGYWGSVSLSNGNGCSLAGILKPFTVSSALLWIKSDNFKGHGLNGGPPVQVVADMDKGTVNSIMDSGRSHIGSSSGPMPYGKPLLIGGWDDRKKKKSKKSLNKLQELTWSDFCKAALEHLQIDLEDVYFVKASNKSKKLKFLKCWMKEVKKSSSVIIPDNDKLHYDDAPRLEDRLNELPEDVAQRPIASSASVGEDSLTGASRVHDEVGNDFQSQTLESFLDDLPHKIQQGLESDDVDLGSLAERLVISSVFWLYKKIEDETNEEVQSKDPRSSEDDSNSTVSRQLMTLLLKEPKDLVAKASNHILGEIDSDRLVREYELQILFRMEILRSDIGASIKESLKQKFVKQICSCLESIQCRLEGGFFGDWNLDKYIGKMIKSRYCDSLGEVVHRIYEKLDLLLFEDEEEPSKPLLNSEDSNHSLKERLETEDERNDRLTRMNDPIPAENNEMKQDDDHARKLMEAQERRQRARRFSSFTSWVPDLHKVWAPKQQPKSKKPKYDRRHSKRDTRRRGSFDVVMETPMTGKEDRSFKGGECSSSNEKMKKQGGGNVCGSVSKALFRD
ncbi:unnamed protein product [Linum tenue]|uniref:Treslin n=1 Tax=Linum tenue TaxID=586396 RepID=A0AAV0MUW1_9ROSI|nr:unnamed protein product [Linum tenue]